MGNPSTVVKPTFTLEQLRRKRGRYEEVNGALCKWCGDCKAFVPIEGFEYKPSLGRHDAYCLPHQAKRVAYACTAEGQAEAAYWTSVNVKRKANLKAGHVPQARKHSRHELVDGVVHKTCTGCDRLLPFDAFKKHGKHLRSECKQCNRPKGMTYRLTHKPQRRRWCNEKYASDIQYRLTVNLRGRLQKCLRGTVKKSEKTLAMLGCSLAQLIQHLESLFQPGMSWDNWGLYGWHIDHIRPCASFDLTDPEQQKACFHWSNLQPLWAVENILKGARENWKGTDG
jgi:hypothetical protein